MVICVVVIECNKDADSLKVYSKQLAEVKRDDIFMHLLNAQKASSPEQPPEFFVLPTSSVNGMCFEVQNLLLFWYCKY